MIRWAVVLSILWGLFYLAFGFFLCWFYKNAVILIAACSWMYSAGYFLAAYFLSRRQRWGGRLIIILLSSVFFLQFQSVYAQTFFVLGALIVPVCVTLKWKELH